MKYEKLIYIYPYSIGSFLNCKAGIEATLEEGDNIDECWDKLRSDVRRLVAKEQGVQDSSQFANQNWPIPSRMMAFPETIGNYIGYDGPNMEASIANCASIKELELYEKPIEREKDEEKKRQLWLIYDKRFTELKNPQQ